MRWKGGGGLPSRKVFSLGSAKKAPRGLEAAAATGQDSWLRSDFVAVINLCSQLYLKLVTELGVVHMLLDLEACRT